MLGFLLPPLRPATARAGLLPFSSQHTPHGEAHLRDLVTVTSTVGLEIGTPGPPIGNDLEILVCG
jgi:hypothetical protein